MYNKYGDPMKVKKSLNILLNILLTIGIMICLCVIVFKLSFISIEVSGNSMLPNAYSTQEGYLLKMNSLRKIKRFDIVAADVNENDEDSRYWIKRVLGLPNEEVELKDDVLYIDGKIVQQDFAYIAKSASYTLRYTLKENEYFIMGDNREVSAYAVVLKSQIVAKDGFVYVTCQSFDEQGICTAAQKGKWVRI